MVAVGTGTYAMLLLGTSEVVAAVAPGSADEGVCIPADWISAGTLICRFYKSGKHLVE
jgi:hypothetical protein